MSNDKEQTVVDQIEEKLNALVNENGTITDYKINVSEIFKQARKTFKQQIMKCSIETTQSCWESLVEEFNQELVFTDEDLDAQKQEAEFYYNETFKN